MLARWTWAVVLLALTAPARSEDLASRLRGPWPAIEAIHSGIDARPIRFPSHSPFKPSDAGRGVARDPDEQASATLFIDRRDGGMGRRPAVIMLHGSGGVLSARELTYGRQFAAMGMVALVVDAFAARRERASGFADRLVEITETMLISDAYAGLRLLAAMPEVDPGRVALVGFSYGAMAATYAAYDSIATRLSRSPLRFAAHAAYYGPCITRFEDPKTTGAPVLMLMGAGDAIIDLARCHATANELRGGGSRVDMIVYPDAVHQWDGGIPGPRPIGRTLAGCRFRVERDGSVRDENTGLPMSGPFLRRVILALCLGSESYMIGRDDRVRARSNADLGEFLATTLGAPARPAP